jgi:hypothetical protein
VLLLLSIRAALVSAQTQVPADLFLAKHRAAVGQNGGWGSIFSIRFKEGRSTFQPGEPIRIELVFDPPAGTLDRREGPNGWTTAQAVLDHEDGVATQALREIALIRLYELTPTPALAAMRDDFVRHLRDARAKRRISVTPLSSALEQDLSVYGPIPGDASRIQFFLQTRGQDSFMGEDLDATLALLPRGTRLDWEDWNGYLDREAWTLAERQALFERERLIAQRYGVVIERSWP